jgi:hypothetical protein
MFYRFWRGVWLLGCCAVWLGCNDLIFLLEGREDLAADQADPPAGVGKPSVDGPLESSAATPTRAKQAAQEPAWRMDHCADAQGYRATRWPQPGELQVDEVMADPPGPDADREWVRISLLAPHPVDLAGLCLVATPPSKKRRRWCLSARVCFQVESPQSVLLAFARSTQATAVAAAVVYVGRQTLPNGPMLLELHSNGQRLDSVHLPRARPGHSTCVRPGRCAEESLPPLAAAAIAPAAAAAKDIEADAPAVTFDEVKSGAAARPGSGVDADAEVEVEVEVAAGAEVKVEVAAGAEVEVAAEAGAGAGAGAEAEAEAEAADADADADADVEVEVEVEVEASAEAAAAISAGAFLHE